MIKVIGLLGVAVVVVGCKAKPAQQQGSFVPMLAQLAANPAAARPVSSKSDGPATSYTYADQADVKKLTMLVAKDRPNAWRMTMESPGPVFSYFTFDPNPQYGAMGSMPSDWSEITTGPLKGNVMHLPNYINSASTCRSAEIFSPAFFVSKSFAFQDVEMIKWACDTSAGGMKPALTSGQFEKKCAEVARKKSPGVSTSGGEVRAAPADCVHAWNAPAFMCVEKKAGEVEVNLK